VITLQRMPEFWRSPGFASDLPAWSGLLTQTDACQSDRFEGGERSLPLLPDDLPILAVKGSRVEI
jgi:hypothetical protein